MQEHYVYEWIRKDLDLPYYIGKGKGKRAYELKRNSHTDTVTNYLLKNGIKREIIIVAKFFTDKQAKEFEKERIAFWWYLKEHRILTNESIGGDGPNGYTHSEERRRKISIAHIGKAKPATAAYLLANNPMKNPATVAKISGDNNWTRKPENDHKILRGEKNAMFGMKGPLSPNFGRTCTEKQIESTRRIGLRNKGKDNPNYGKVTSLETRAKLSASNVGQKRSEETKEKMRKPRSEAGRAAIAASNKARAEKKRAEKLVFKSLPEEKI